MKGFKKMATAFALKVYNQTVLYITIHQDFSRGALYIMAYTPTEQKPFMLALQRSSTIERLKHFPELKYGLTQETIRRYKYTTSTRCSFYVINKKFFFYPLHYEEPQIYCNAIQEAF